eukprot:s1085_g1.t1
MPHLRLPGSQNACTDASRKRAALGPEAQLRYTSNLQSDSVASKSRYHSQARPTTNNQSACTHVYASVAHWQAVGAVEAATQHFDTHTYDCDNAADNKSTYKTAPLHSGSHDGDKCEQNAAVEWHETLPQQPWCKSIGD